MPRACVSGIIHPTWRARQALVGTLGHPPTASICKQVILSIHEVAFWLRAPQRIGVQLPRARRRAASENSPDLAREAVGWNGVLGDDRVENVRVSRICLKQRERMARERRVALARGQAQGGDRFRSDSVSAH